MGVSAKQQAARDKFAAAGRAKYAGANKKSQAPAPKPAGKKKK